MARDAAAKEEVKKSRSVGHEDARTLSRGDSLTFHEVMEVVQANGEPDPAKAGDPAAATNNAFEDGFKTAFFDLVAEPVQACDRTVTGKAGDTAAMTNKASEDDRKTTISDLKLVMETVQACDGTVNGKAGDAAAVTNKASEDEQKTTILDPNLVLEHVQVRGGAITGKKGNAVAVTNKTSKDEQKTTILDSKVVKHAKAQVVAKKGKDKKGKQKEDDKQPIEEQVVAKKGGDKKRKQKGDDKSPIFKAKDAIPEPIATLDLQQLPESLMEVVVTIKRKIGKESIKKFIVIEDGKERCIPVTPGPDDSCGGVYVIKVINGTRTLRLVAQKYQTWFRSIVTTNGEWFEIEGMEPKMMEGSKSLYTRSSYSDLLGPGNNVAACKIGFDPLMRSFDVLAGHVGQNKENKECKKAIAVLLVMLFEAPRFPAVFEKIMELLRAEEEDTVGEDLKMLINNWCDISMDFYMANGEEERVTLTDKTSPKIRKAVMGVSLFCGSNWIKWQEANSKKKQIQNQHWNTKVQKL